MRFHGVNTVNDWNNTTKITFAFNQTYNIPQHYVLGFSTSSLAIKKEHGTQTNWLEINFPLDHELLQGERITKILFIWHIKAINVMIKIADNT